MLCERCKMREANIQYTEVINGITTEHSLCSQCAKELDIGIYSAIFDGDTPFSKLISGLLALGESSARQTKMNQVICPGCKQSYEDFVKNSSFGCADCYGVFDLLISDNLKQLQGSDTHLGKKPRFGRQMTEHPIVRADADINDVLTDTLSMEEQIDLLQAKLNESLRHEAYEEAAEYRDAIKSLQGGNHV